MSTNAPKQLSESVDYPAPKKYVLVLSCVDARLLDDLVRCLDNDNLTNRYYHITLPGTSLGLTNRVKQEPPVSGNKGLKKQFARWRQTFIEQVQAAVLLTKGAISDIYIVQHEDCGAFRVYIEKDSANLTAAEELSLHHEFAHALLEDLVANFCTTYNHFDAQGKPTQKKPPFVHSFYMDLRGKMKCLESHVH